jgi:hypothetical protein
MDFSGCKGYGKRKPETAPLETKLKVKTFTGKGQFPLVMSKAKKGLVKAYPLVS